MTASRALTRVPLALTGQWSAGGGVWTARVHSAQPLVCVSFLAKDRAAHWAKSGRLQDAREALRVGLGIDSNDPARITIGFGFIAEPARLVAPGWRPLLAERRSLETRVIWRLCTFESAPAITLAALFLAAADVHFSRNHLWRLRDECLAGTPLRALLAGGRSGTCAWPPPDASA